MALASQRDHRLDTETTNAPIAMREVMPAPPVSIIAINDVAIDVMITHDGAVTRKNTDDAAHVYTENSAAKITKTNTKKTPPIFFVQEALRDAKNLLCQKTPVSVIIFFTAYLWGGLAGILCRL